VLEQEVKERTALMADGCCLHGESADSTSIAYAAMVGYLDGIRAAIKATPVKRVEVDDE